jgi:hypothetical protein
MLQRIDVERATVVTIDAAVYVCVSELNPREDHMRSSEVVDKECGCGQ